MDYVRDFFRVNNQLNLDLQIITNPVISTRKGRPSGRAKSTIEIQDSHAKKRKLLSNIDNNIQPSNEESQPSREKDTRKHCQKCGQKGHNRVTCKTVISNVNNENTR